MLDLRRVFEYMCNKYYVVIYKCNYYDDEHKVNGILLNYNGGDIVLLSEDGVYHIKCKDIVFMKPIKFEVHFESFNKEYRDLLEYCCNNDNNESN